MYQLQMDGLAPGGQRGKEISELKYRNRHRLMAIIVDFRPRSSIDFSLLLTTTLVSHRITRIADRFG